MNRAVTLVLVFGIVVGGLTTAEAAKKKREKPAPRVVEKDYAPRSDGGRMLVAPGSLGVTLTQVSFTPTSKEKRVSIALADVSGLPVRAAITQGGSFLTGYFCGKTDAPVTIAPGYEIEVWIYSGPCGSGVALGTQGTITATFSP